MRGIFVNFSSIRHDRPYLFSRGPTVNPSVALDACALDFMHHLCRGYQRETILDHRNGLLLYMNGLKIYVCNPATCRWAELPPMPSRWSSAAYLVFDPVVSLHYDVFIFRNTGKGNTPPSTYMIPVYSSKTDQWEEWPFIREGDATAITMVSGQLGDPKRRGAVCWRGALYLHCCSGLLTKLSLDKKTYLVIKIPEITMMPTSHGYSMDSSKPRVYLEKSEEGVYYTTIYQCQFQMRAESGTVVSGRGAIGARRHTLTSAAGAASTPPPAAIRSPILLSAANPVKSAGAHFDPSSSNDATACKEMWYYMDSSKPRVYLGKSEEGVYYTTIYQCQIQVWVLLEASCPMPEWVLKHHSNLVPCIQRHYHRQYYEGEKANKPCIRGDCEWEFIGGSVHDSEEQEGKAREGQRYYYIYTHIDLLGYHPFKDIAVLGINSCDGFAYYLDTCELRYLGSIMSPTRCRRSQEATIQESFIYTPCKHDLLPNHEESAEELFEESFINMYYLNDALDG
uniref:F-box associated domain-containing protein n=1 Tax=Aegilops tauschii TaxID=37682 RepID=M8CAG0_AEGTA